MISDVNHKRELSRVKLFERIDYAHSLVHFECVNCWSCACKRVVQTKSSLIQLALSNAEYIALLSADILSLICVFGEQIQFENRNLGRNRALAPRRNAQEIKLGHYPSSQDRAILC